MGRLEDNGYTRVSDDSGVYMLKHTDNTYIAAFVGSRSVFKPFYRNNDETFKTACAREIQDSAIICNGPYFDTSSYYHYTRYAAGFLVSGTGITQLGQVYIDGVLQPDSNSETDMFYVNQSSSKQYSFGEGDPATGYNAIGNLTPLILNNYRPLSNIIMPISFGEINVYDNFVEKNVPEVSRGNPAQVHEDNLIQRSNTRNGQLTAGQGITSLGYNPIKDLLLVICRDNAIASGVSEHETKSAIEHFAFFKCTSAVAFDVSTSCVMRTKKKYYVEPDKRKDNSIEVGFKISYA